ncbi:MAG: hypothetical protein MZU84_00760 [Sphingobacterium sp.]|nr:hypothetical protein [Sphingobacterium sp.]
MPSTESVNRTTSHAQVRQHQCGGRFHDRHGRGRDARVMPSLYLKLGLPTALHVQRSLPSGDGRRGLDGHAEDDRHAVGYSAQYARRRRSWPCGALPSTSTNGSLCCEPRMPAAAESCAELDSLDAGNGEHHLGQLPFDRIEERLPQSYRHPIHDALHHPADAVAFILGSQYL